MASNAVDFQQRPQLDPSAGAIHAMGRRARMVGAPMRLRESDGSVDGSTHRGFHPSPFMREGL